MGYFVRVVVVLLGVHMIYWAVVGWAVFGRGVFRYAYNPVVGWWLDRFGMEAVTVGARCYLCSADRMLTTERRAHEYFHYWAQWRVYPLTFLPRYVIGLIRYGYDKHPMEQEARLAGGEPLR